MRGPWLIFLRIGGVKFAKHDSLSSPKLPEATFIGPYEYNAQAAHYKLVYTESNSRE